MTTVIKLTPHQRYLMSLDQYGAPLVPADPYLRITLMQPEPRKITSAGATIDHLRYDHPSIDEARGLVCPATGTERWVFRKDPRDISRVYLDLNQGTDEAPRWVEVPWVHRPNDMRFPFPEKLKLFLRSHRAQLGVSGDPIGWRPVGDGEDPVGDESEDELMANQIAHFCRWLADLDASRPGKGFEKLPSSGAVAEIVEAARSLARWRQSRAAMAIAARQAGLEQRVQAESEAVKRSAAASKEDEDGEPPDNLL